MSMKYKVFVEGRNFRINVDGLVENQGFYTTRFIEADDAATAENKALNLIRDELRGIVMNAPSDPPVLYIEETHEMKSFEGHLPPGRGFTWFPGEES
jgi:hypothetical protein